MKYKWQFFVVGLLCGFLVSGIAILVVNRIQRMNFNTAVRAVVNESASLPVSAITQMVDNSEGNLGKINLNQATLEDLMTLPNIGEAKAKAIIAFRETYGDFENVDELLYVSGIGPEIYKGLADLVFVQ